MLSMRFISYVISAILFLSFLPILYASNYLIEEVEVDVTAESVTKAREQALIEARRKAFQILLENNFTPVEQSNLQKISDETLEEIIKTLEVVREKQSSMRYSATFNIEFKPKSINKLLKKDSNALNQSIAKTTKILLIPVLVEQEKIHLWDGNNPWFNFWNEDPKEHENIILPLADLEDLKILSIKSYKSQDQQAFAKLLNHYHTERGVLAVFNDQTIELINFTKDAMLQADAFNLKTSQTQAYSEAQQLILEYIKHPLSTSSTTIKPQEILDIFVPINSFQDWIHTRQILEKEKCVLSSQVLELTRESGKLRLSLNSNIEQCLPQLRQMGIMIEQLDGTWTLSLSSMTGVINNASNIT